MRAHQIMTRPVISVTPDTKIADAANTMLQKHVSGLPVVDATGKLVGIVSEGDFIRRSEIGTAAQARPVPEIHPRPGQGGGRFRSRARPQGLRDHDAGAAVRSTKIRRWRQIVELMEKNNVKRLPVMRADKIVGIVSRANLLQAVASLARDIPDPTADDDHIRNRVIDASRRTTGARSASASIVRDGIVHLERRHHRGAFAARPPLSRRRTSPA